MRPAVEPREVEHVVEHAEQAARGLIEHLGITRLRGVEGAGQQQLGHGGDRLHGRAEFMPDHGEQLGLRLVGRLGGLARAALGGEPIDKTLNLREQIVRPKILRSHHHLPAPFQRRPGWQRSLKSRLNCRAEHATTGGKIGFNWPCAGSEPKKICRKAWRRWSAPARIMARVHALSGDPPLRRRPAGFEGLSRVIVGQQLSVASANAIWGRLEARVQPFTAASLLAVPHAELRAAGLSAVKTATLRRLAEAIASRRSRPRCAVRRSRNGHS